MTIIYKYESLTVRHSHSTITGILATFIIGSIPLAYGFSLLMVLLSLLGSIGVCEHSTTICFIAYPMLWSMVILLTFLLFITLVILPLAYAIAK